MNAPFKPSLSAPQQAPADENFGHWQVLGADATGKRVACRCVCGVVRIVGVVALRSGACTSCGCQKPTSAQRKTARDTCQILLSDFGLVEKI
jgi:hypothetical protein